MPENNQEEYRTLGWIVNKSDQGLFLVVADETSQREIVEIYRQGAVKIYDCKRHPGEFFSVICSNGRQDFRKQGLL